MYGSHPALKPCSTIPAEQPATVCRSRPSVGDRAYSFSSDASAFTNSTTFRRTLASIMRAKARLSCRPSPLLTKSTTNLAASPSDSPSSPDGARALRQRKGNRNVEDRGDCLQPTCSDAIGPLFVFLDLLERNSKAFAKFFLAHPEDIPSQSDPASDIYVRRIWPLLVSLFPAFFSSPFVAAFVFLDQATVIGPLSFPADQPAQAELLYHGFVISVASNPPHFCDRFMPTPTRPSKAITRKPLRLGAPSSGDVRGELRRSTSRLPRTFSAKASMTRPRASTTPKSRCWRRAARAFHSRQREPAPAEMLVRAGRVAEPGIVRDIHNKSG